MDKKDTRYPYTYACDLIRSTTEYTKDGCTLSRSDASKIRSLIAGIISMPDEELANKLADYYIDHETEITERGVQEFMRAQKGLQC